MQLKGLAILPKNFNILKEDSKDEAVQRSIRAVKDIALDIAKVKPETILVISKDGNIFDDAVNVDFTLRMSGSLDEDGVSVSMEKECDMGLLEEINSRSNREELPVFMMNTKKAEEYGVEQELTPATITALYYIDKVYPDYKIVQVTTGDVARKDLYEIGMILREAAEANQKPAYAIVCENQSDCLESAYDEYREAGQSYDAQVQADLKDQDYLDLMLMKQRFIEKADAQGYDSLMIYLGMLEKIKNQTEVLSYEAPMGQGWLVAKSAFDLEGDFIIPSVLKEYVDVRTREREALQAQEPEILKMIRQAAKLWVEHQKKLDLSTYLELMEDKELAEQLVNQQTGVYVTIYKDGRMRGCMGSVTPTAENVGEALINYTIEACAYDTRFVPVTEEELPQLSFTVDILETPETVEDPKQELDPARYGIIVEQGVYRSVVLPNTPGIFTPEDQVQRALERAGIHRVIMDDEDRLVIQRFETEHFEA